MAKIRDDLVGVVYVGQHVLRAGDTVPDGVFVAGHLTDDGEPANPPVPLTGPSAYDVAVSNGFEGDEEEWLDSLKGDPGAPGPTAVSADADNTATLGTDGLIFVPAAGDE